MQLSVLTSLCLATLAVVQAVPPPHVEEKRNNHYLPALNAASQGRKPEHPVIGPNGAVATEVDVCSNVGADLLQKGGSAADAIIGAAFCVNSIDSFHSGIAGGGFIVLRDEKKQHSGQHDGVRVIDMRESAPAASNETMYSANPNKNASTIGGLAVGVPGELRGFETLHNKHGKLPWHQVIQPAIELNRYGFKVTNQLSYAIEEYKDSLLCNTTYWKDVYCPNGTAAKLGDTIKNERLATTFEIIAKKGVDAFYTGAIANRTIETIRNAGGIMTMDDLKEYKAIDREPFSIEFPDNKRVYSSGAPSSGAVVLSALKTMSEYGLKALENDGVNLTTHRLIEATKFAYGERADYGDPSYVKNVTRLEKHALTDKDCRKKRSLISDNSTHPTSYYDPKNYTILTDSGTSQLSAIDDDGLSVTLTTTVNLFWGAQLMTPDGFVLNDELDDFSSPGSSNAFGYTPTEANFIRPGKRPLSSISPVIIVDLNSGKTTHALGSAGGSRIITANIINTFNALRGIDLQKSIDMPRWHDQLLPATTSFEWQNTTSPTIPNWKGFDNSTVAFLKSVGHNVSWVAPGSSTAQGVYRAKEHQQYLYKGAYENRQLSAGAAAI
ncbi:gamma-glutamyltranspeptidase [Meira miltonrushii]|uniref:Glutathione hydrolase n=1 Tax=Meira miltonrushii TaxID=1280837 RepID=A0A316VHI0_9BASI|nr:gamma-glutamyltranspeptidase [Meira miltonrushii]PWN37052.1 gamma-glutamyltranspeptidase [Meira miltonrushii]